jgi:hypothetical protein
MINISCFGSEYINLHANKSSIWSKCTEGQLLLEEQRLNIERYLICREKRWRPPTSTGGRNLDEGTARHDDVTCAILTALKREYKYTEYEEWDD